MKILFLDVDGVLNSTHHPGFRKPRRTMGIDDWHCRNLERIFDAHPDLKCVVSSTWRLGGTHPGSRFHETLMAAKGGHTVYKAVIGRTPDLRGTRGDEIREWLTINALPLWVTHFVSLDDDPSPPNLVQTTMGEGLTPELADVVIGRLK